MPELVKEPQPPTGWRRLLWRAPILIYTLHLGWLVPKRLMLLQHTGRSSGLRRKTVVEVVQFVPETGAYVAASGFGTRSDWYQNVKAHPDVVIQVGGRSIPATAVLRTPDESGQTMVDYARRHAKAAGGLMKLIGYKVDGTNEDYYAVGHDHIPFVVFEPRPAVD